MTPRSSQAAAVGRGASKAELNRRVRIQAREFFGDTKPEPFYYDEEGKIGWISKTVETDSELAFETARRIVVDAFWYFDSEGLSNVAWHLMDLAEYDREQTRLLAEMTVQVLGKLGTGSWRYDTVRNLLYAAQDLRPYDIELSDWIASRLGALRSDGIPKQVAEWRVQFPPPRPDHLALTVSNIAQVFNLGTPISDLEYAGHGSRHRILRLTTMEGTFAIKYVSSFGLDRIDHFADAGMSRFHQLPYRNAQTALELQVAKSVRCQIGEAVFPVGEEGSWSDRFRTHEFTGPHGWIRTNFGKRTVIQPKEEFRRAKDVQDVGILRVYKWVDGQALVDQILDYPARLSAPKNFAPLIEYIGWVEAEIMATLREQSVTSVPERIDGWRAHAFIDVPDPSAWEKQRDQVVKYWPQLLAQFDVLQPYIARLSQYVETAEPCMRVVHGDLNVGGLIIDRAPTGLIDVEEFALFGFAEHVATMAKSMGNAFHDMERAAVASAYFRGLLANDRLRGEERRAVTAGYASLWLHAFARPEDRQDSKPPRKRFISGEILGGSPELHANLPEVLRMPRL